MRFLIALLLSVATLHAQAQFDDPVLQAMSAEMKRSKERLRLEQEKTPYYIEYSIQDQDGYNGEAAMGAVRSELHARARLVRVFVRVGDKHIDNSMPWSPTPGAIELAVVDDDVIALRHVLWLATDKAYKSALQQYTAKQALVKQFESVAPVDDFAEAPPVREIAPLARLDRPLTKYGTVLEKMTAPGRAEKNVQEFKATARFTASNKYFINSEGTVTRQGQTILEVRMEGDTQAADGMSLELSKSHVWTTSTEILSQDKFEAEAKELIASLTKLREAPMVDDQYRGPVLFSSSAAGQVVSSLIGENIVGKRPRLGETARVRGSFAHDFKARVLPDSITIADDPTVQTFQGRTLAGAYKTDDEGVKAQPVTVIEKGVLVAYLTGRSPIKDFPTSNGHARLGFTQTVEPRVGNLFFRSSRTTPEAELMKQFIESCKQRELEYCYRVESLGRTSSPRMLYRVYPKDGHEELVRGASIGQLDMRSLRNDISGVGDRQEVNNFSGGAPFSVIAPALLFDELEIKKANDSKDKLPYYPRPATQ
jgi:predicted Zn-dependent protease